MNVKEMKAQLLSLADTFKKKEELTDLDRAIGDGDHGVNMERGFSHLEVLTIVTWLHYLKQLG